MLWYNNPEAMRAIQESNHGTEDDRRREYALRRILRHTR